MTLNYYVHPNAIVESINIGEETRIWAFAHILPGAVIGQNCNICDHTFIENDVKIGDNVTIKCGVQLWDGVIIEDDVFIGPNVSFTNDNFPRSRKKPTKFLTTIIRKGASIGANATILPGITIGQNAMVGAGSVVTQNVPPNALVIGNPAKIDGYVTLTGRNKTVPLSIIGESADPEESREIIGGARLFKMPIFRDMRGALIFGQINDHLPFVPKRFFVVYNVPSQEVRGEHAHRTLEQILICLKGSCNIVIDDASRSVEVVLNDMSHGLYIAPMLWCVQYKFTPDAMLLVLASDIYDNAEYIRNYQEYLTLKAHQK